MRIVQYFIAVAAVGGQGLAVLLGQRPDAAPMAAQMQLNLLGWMSLGLYGLYYCSPGPVMRPRLAWLQAVAAILGFAGICGGMAALAATGDQRFGALVAVGALLAVAGVVLFVVQLLPQGRAGRAPAPTPA
jgi:hypothetical protein